MGNNSLLFESLFKRNAPAPDIKHLLKEIAKDHPYFSPAQFYLLLYSDPGTIAYDQQASKTAALFNNPYWLQFQLQEQQELQNDRKEPAIQDDEIAVKYENIPRCEDVVEENQVETDAEVADVKAQQSVPGENFSVHETLAAETILDEQANNFEETPAEEIGTDKSEDINIHEPGTSKEIIFIRDETLQADQSVHPKESQQREEQLAQSTVVAGNENEMSMSADPAEESTEEGALLLGGEISPDKDPPNSGETTSANLPFKPAFRESSFSTDNINDDNINASEEKEPLNFTLNRGVPGRSENHNLFEPLYTTDYFASQGIKINADIKPDDKLGKQLKSFTDWLKTMKKVHSTTTHINEGADSTIQKLAEESNKEDEVVTETMAEVLLQQGKREKSIEVYQKLSLLNPSKTAYFAAKIDQLKEH